MLIKVTDIGQRLAPIGIERLHPDTEAEGKAPRTYQRRTLTADALIAGAYLAGTNTRRVRRALAALFRGAVSKDIVSQVWRKDRTAEYSICRKFKGFPAAQRRSSGKTRHPPPHRRRPSWWQPPGSRHGPR
jgi:hypothetical protein